MGVGSYLTVGLLFGLTLPGVSAHGFLVGRGEEEEEEAGQQGYTPSQKNHFSRPQRERERETTGRKRQEEKEEERQIQQRTGRRRRRQIKTKEGDRVLVTQIQTADTP